MTARLLLLAGTAEARALAEALSTVPGLEVTASLAGVTRNPAPIAAVRAQFSFSPKMITARTATQTGAVNSMAKTLARGSTAMPKYHA